MLDSNVIVPEGWYGDGFDTLQVFSTYVWSPADVSLALQLGGDAGHSLFVNDGFVGGGGFGATIDYTLVLDAGVAKKLTFAGYNGPGNWVFGIWVPDSGNHTPIAWSAPGVVINADGKFAPVPEPTSVLLLGMGIGAIAAARRRRRLRI